MLRGVMALETRI